MLIAPLAAMSSVSASMESALVVPAVTVPLTADKITSPADAMLPIMMLPFLDVMLTLPALPVMAVIRISPSATMVMSPPVVLSIAMLVNVIFPLTSAILAVSVTVRLPGFVNATAKLSTFVFKVRSSPALTANVLAVTESPRVRLSFAVNVMFVPTSGETITREPVLVLGEPFAK